MIICLSFSISSFLMRVYLGQYTKKCSTVSGVLNEHVQISVMVSLNL